MLTPRTKQQQQQHQQQTQLQTTGAGITQTNIENICVVYKVIGKRQLGKCSQCNQPCRSKCGNKKTDRQCNLCYNIEQSLPAHRSVQTSKVAKQTSAEVSAINLSQHLTRGTHPIGRPSSSRRLLHSHTHARAERALPLLAPTQLQSRLP